MKKDRRGLASRRKPSNQCLIQPRMEYGEYGTVREITKHKRIKEERREAKDRLEFLVTSCPAVLYTCKPYGDYSPTYVSGNVKSQLGFEPREFIDDPKFWVNHIHPEDKTRVLAIGPDHQILEYRFQCKSGSYRWIQDELNRVRDAAGNPIEMIGYWSDITERKQAEEEVKRLQEYLQLQINRMPIGLIVWTPEFRVQSWNPAAERIFGFTAEEAVGRHPYELIVPREAQAQVDDVWRRLLEGDMTADSVNENVTKTGNRILCEWSNTPLRKADGTTIGVLSMVQDITDRKRAEEALRENEKRLTEEITELNEVHGELERYSKQLQESREKLRALHQHALQLGSASNIEEVVKSTLDAIEFALGFDVADAYIRAGDSLRLWGARGAPIGLSEERLNGRGLVAKAARTQATVCVSDTTKEPDYVDRKGWDWTGPHTALSELAVPVVVDGETIAVLNAESFRPGAFSSEDQRLLETLAAHVGSEIEHLKDAQELEAYSKHLEELVEERAKKLHESEERYRSIVQNIPGVVWTSNEKSDTVFVTPNVKELYGHSPEEFYAGGREVWSRHMHPDDRAKVNEAYDALFTDRKEFNVEYRYQRPDGRWLWLQDRANIVYEKDEVRYTDGVTTNITEHKQIEEELHAAKEELEYVISANPAVVYTGKPFPDQSDFFATYISKNIVSLLGFEDWELTGGSGAEFWLSRLPPEDYRRYQAEVPLLWRDGHHTFEYRFLHKDGSYRWIREEEKAIFDSEGQVRDIVGYWTDITEHKRLEEDLLKSQRLAAIGETATMVAHDLRNPLQGITTAIYLLKRDSLTAKQKDEMLQLIQDSVNYSESIVGDLLAYSAEINLKLADTTPKSIIREALSGVRVPREVAINDNSEEYPAIKVDSDRMRRVIVNLVENAVDAMPQGGTLTIDSEQSNDCVEIALSDTGMGVPEKVMQNLWKPLQTTKAKGLGLGLAICKRIVDAHGGDISVKSRIGEGTTITVRLPIEPDMVEVRQK